MCPGSWGPIRVLVQAHKGPKWAWCFKQNQHIVKSVRKCSNKLDIDIINKYLLVLGMLKKCFWSDWDYYGPTPDQNCLQNFLYNLHSYSLMGGVIYLKAPPSGLIPCGGPVAPLHSFLWMYIWHKWLTRCLPSVLMGGPYIQTIGILVDRDRDSFEECTVFSYC